MRPQYKTLSQTVALVLVMGGLAWASVPFYDWFCRITGFGGVTATAEVGSDTVLEDKITIRFMHLLSVKWSGVLHLYRARWILR